jgi:glycosyltransferase involved in cell wall biosynthesis
MELWPIIEKSHLFIRPTNTDGYALSVAEAIYCKIPTIASNVANRPEGTILFEARNFQELLNRTLEVINDYQCFKEKARKVKLKDNLENLLNIYREIGDKAIGHGK